MSENVTIPLAYARGSEGVSPVTAALLDELRRLARQLSPNDTPATVFRP